MLGDQLIKNERIALVEIIKNSYDADADWVRIDFFTNQENLFEDSGPKIIIEDNGHGMTKEILENHWLNPATPQKSRRKNEISQKGRVLQGEKGIGRFALLKLGRTIKLVTRVKGEPVEHCIEFDFSNYDEDFHSVVGDKQELFLDELKVEYYQRQPQHFVGSEVFLGTEIKNRSDHGTIIEIKKLENSWDWKQIEPIQNDLTKFQSIFSDKESDFKCIIYLNGECGRSELDFKDKLKLLMEEKSILRIENGYFESEKKAYYYKINGENKILDFSDSKLRELKLFADNFGKTIEALEHRKIDCGSFHFGFYIFDLRAPNESKHWLDREQKKLLSEHRIYLYRDGVRVYPYGDPEDDWLRIDAYRGTIKSGDFFSNDQVVGYIEITHQGNPNLRDKTNREGLIDEGNRTEDFIAVIQSFLAYLRKTDYAKYRFEQERSIAAKLTFETQLLKDIDTLKSEFSSNKTTVSLLDRIKTSYNNEKSSWLKRFELTEELAGVGLSVETASHDIMSLIGKVVLNLDTIVRDLSSSNHIDKKLLLKELSSILDGTRFIHAQLKDIQLLFTSSKQRRRELKIKEVLDKVLYIYRKLLEKESIEVSVREVGATITARTTDAILLQLFLNLIDNAVYWLGLTSKNRKINVLFDGENKQVIISDNGPGIKEEDAPYIFEPFYSGKGELGRGLGLYIARQLLARHDYSIRLAEKESERILSGANFIINFQNKENQ